MKRWIAIVLFLFLTSYSVMAGEMEDVKRVQSLLNAFGYSCGAADGILGVNTESAISRFQKDHGLKEDGKISEDLWKTLSLYEDVSKVNTVVKTIVSHNGEVSMANMDADQVWGMLRMYAIFDIQNSDHANTYSIQEIREICYALFDDFDGTVPLASLDTVSYFGGSYSFSLATPLVQTLTLTHVSSLADDQVEATYLYTLQVGSPSESQTTYTVTLRKNRYSTSLPYTVVSVWQEGERSGGKSLDGKSRDGNEEEEIDIESLEAGLGVEVDIETLEMQEEQVKDTEDTKNPMSDEEAESTASERAYVSAYISELLSLPSSMNDYIYYLIYVDADSIPELVVDSGDRAGGCGIYSYRPESDEVIRIGLRFPFLYAERMGFVIWHDILNNGELDYVWTLDEMGWNQVAKGFHRMDGHGSAYLWNDALVTEEEYVLRLEDVYEGKGDVADNSIEPTGGMEYGQLLASLHA